MILCDVCLVARRRQTLAAYLVKQIVGGSEMGPLRLCREHFAVALSEPEAFKPVGLAVQS